MVFSCLCSYRSAILTLNLWSQHKLHGFKGPVPSKTAPTADTSHTSEAPRPPTILTKWPQIWKVFTTPIRLNCLLE